MEKRALKLRILFFTQYFWPENFRINEIVENYKDQKNTILTSYPSYPTYKNFKTFSRNQKSNLTNAKIFRMPVIPRSSSNILILLNYLSFIVMSFFYTFFVFFRRKIDLVFIFCPSPILSAIPLILINKIFKKKSCYMGFRFMARHHN